MPTLQILGGVVAGIGIGYIIWYIRHQLAAKNVDFDIKAKTLKAKEEIQTMMDEAKEKAEKIITEARDKHDIREKELITLQEKFLQKEELLEARRNDITNHEQLLKTKIEEIEALKVEARQKLDERAKKIEDLAKLTKDEALDLLKHEVAKDHQDDLAKLMATFELQKKEELGKRAQDILVSTIHRLASSTASEITVTTVQIPSDEIKGKVIGREGRNIRTFERVLGVELLVDDTPGAIIISSFDPVRRQIARVALENLISDGRIQPAKIEEFAEKAKSEIHEIIKQQGEAACLELGIYNFDPRLVALVGRLHFRTSYGQNVLNHSIEMAHLAAMLAEELGADVYISKAAALVHDIGKALDHEFQGSHIEIGIKVLRKYGVDERIITAMKSHHDDYPHETIEAVIIQTCDMISGARPGARRDTVENYIKRLTDLENIANNMEGIEKAYALSAGREIRVFVNPHDITDMDAYKLARELAQKIESSLSYPGEIKITLIRESRIIDFAR
ncbi:MAG TPA: ribonuclease Y [Candidatus Paceibacterota bacterium]